jgi:hypothetical protein
MMRVKLLPITLVMTLVASTGFASDIRIFTDSQGVLHISNVKAVVHRDANNISRADLAESPLAKLPTSPVPLELLPKAENLEPALAASQAASLGGGGLQTQPHTVEELFQRVYAAAQELQTGMATVDHP